jgi:hypothetical protein
MSQQQGQQKQQPIQVHIIGKNLSMVGHSFMFPKGSKVHIQKRVDDLKSKKSVYQGVHFSTGSVVEVQFDAKTLRHMHYEDKPQQGAYRVSLIESELEALELPAIPF